MIIDNDNGKVAITEYKVLNDIGSRVGLIALYPKTGRTHQLRVHAAHKNGLNTPIVGDDLYGKKSNRLFLHAESIEFEHPTSKKRINIKCEAPF